jgi:hypothetical protein
VLAEVAGLSFLELVLITRQWVVLAEAAMEQSALMADPEVAAESGRMVLGVETAPEPVHLRSEALEVTDLPPRSDQAPLDPLVVAAVVAMAPPS